MHDSRLSNRSSESSLVLPKKQEWALINQQRALEFQRAKSMQKMLSQEKRDTFKQQLDKQLMQKHSLKNDQKEEDRKYHDYIVLKAQELKEKEEKDKFRKFLQSKEMQEQNKRQMDSHINPRAEDYGKIYNIPIGLKSEIQKKQRAEAIRKNVISSLDRQREQKDFEKRTKRQQDQFQYQRNQDYQNQLFQNRNGGGKVYQQSEKVYNYYKDIYQHKVRKDKDLERKLVDNVQVRDAQAAERRRQREINDKERKNIEIKDTLEKQMQLQNRKKEEDQKFNPQQVNYSFIGNIFRQKKPSYDKKEYSMFLDRQSEQQKHNKLSQKYMSEQEYRYNSNQLNKAITGAYTNDRYHDRSMNSIGDRLNMSAMEPLRAEDSDLVKNKLEVARSHHKPRNIERAGSPFEPVG